MQSVQRLWGEKFIKVWYNKSYAAGRFPYNDKNEGMHMANGIIFLVGALIMFYMALRSVRQRRSLCTNGEKVQARITGTVQSRDGTAYVLEFTTAGGSHRLRPMCWSSPRRAAATGCSTPNPPAARILPRAAW